MLLFAWTLFFLHIDTYAASGNTTRIHFIALYGASDAILLESNGHFGMVDSGEDWDYPSGSTGSKYPYRYGITTNEGYEQQVIHNLVWKSWIFTLQRMRTVITSEVEMRL